MDEELQAIVQRMIDAGEPEDNIAKVIQSWEPKKAPEVSGQGSPSTSQTSTEPSQTSPQGAVDVEESARLAREMNPSTGEIVGLQAQPSADDAPSILTAKGVEQYQKEQGERNARQQQLSDRLNYLQQGNQSINKDALQAAINITPEDTLEQVEEKRNLASDVIYGINNTVNSLVSGASKIPALAYDIAAVPQNLIADLTGIESLRASSEQFADQVGLVNPVSSFVDPYIEQYEQQVRAKYAPSVTEAFSKGDYEAGIRSLILQVGESLPFMAAVAATGGGAATNIGLGATLSANQYEELEGTDISDPLKLTNALLNGYSELIFERIGTGNILRSADDILKRSGREAAENFARKSFTDIYEGVMRKYFPITAPLAEGLEEAATAYTQNVVDRITGVDPQRDLSSGLWDSFVVGAAAGSTVATPVSIINRISNRSNREKAEKLFEENQEIANLGVENLTPEEAGVLGTRYKTNNEAINDILEQDAEVRQQLTPEQSSEVEAYQKRVDAIDSLLEKEQTPEVLKETLRAEKEGIIGDIDNIVSTSTETVTPVTEETDTQPEQVTEATAEVTEPTVPETTDTDVQQDEVISPTEQPIQVNVTEVENFTPEDNTRINETLSTRERIAQRRQELGDSLAQRWQSYQNQGITPRQQNLSEDVQMFKELVEYAALTIAEGTINTAQELRSFLNIDNDIVDRAFDAARGAITEQQVQDQTVRPTRTTKQTISQATEGRMRGTVTVTQKQALTNQIRTFNKGIREGIAQTKEANKGKTRQAKYETRFLKAEINTQLDNAKKAGVFKNDVQGRAVERLSRTINNADTPIKLVKAIDVVERTIRDVQYTQKRRDAVSNASKIKKRARQKTEPKRGGIPLNVKNTLRELGSATPVSSELLQEYNTFTNRILGNITQEKAINVSREDVDALMDRVRKEVANQRQQNIERYLELRDIDTSGMDAETLNASYEDLKTLDLDDSTGSDNVRDTLDAVTEVLRQEMSEADLTEANSIYPDEVDALTNIDTEKLSNNEVKFLNNAIYNLVNNGRVDGVGATITSKHKFLQELSTIDPQQVNRSVLKLNNYMKWLIRGGASASLTIKSAFSDIRTVAPKVRSILGLTQLLNNEKTVNRTERNFEEGILKLSKKYKSLRTAESQIRIAMVSELVQHDLQLDEGGVQQEFDGRKEAVRLSVERTLEQVEKDSDFKNKYGNYAKAVEKVWDDIKDADTPEQALNKLSNPQRELHTYLLDAFSGLRERMKYVTEVYGNAQWRDIENYIPRSYLNIRNVYQTDAPAYTESSYIAGQPVTGTIAGGSNQRILNGAQLPSNAFLNFDLFNGAVKEYRNQLYDVTTLPTRHMMRQAITSRELKEVIGDEAIINIFDQSLQRTVDAQKMYRVKSQSRNLLAAIGRFYSGLGNKIALGGVLSFAKQYAPTLAVTQLNMPVNHMDIPWRVMTMSMQKRGDFQRLIQQFPVSERHRNSSGLFFQNVNNIKFSRLTGDMRSSFRDVATRGLNRLDEFSDVSLRPLTAGDQSSANIAWLSYYIADQLNRGQIKEFKDFDLQKNANAPDPTSVSYAEQMTSTTLNTNLGSESSKFMQGNSRFLMNMLIPFASFQINEFVNMNTDVNVAASKNVSPQDRMDAAQRIVARVAGVAAINFVGWAIRDLFTRTAYQTVASLVTADDDDDSDEETLKLLKKHENESVQRNIENSLGYALTDLVFGQMVGHSGDGIFRSIETLVASASGDRANNVTWQDPFGTLGKLGIPLKSMNNLLTSTNEFMVSDEEWRQKKYAIETADGSIELPPDYQDAERPFYTRATMAFSTFSAVPQLLGLSTQEVGSLSRAMQRAAKQAEQEQYGRDKKISQEKLDESLRTFTRDGTKYNVDGDDLKELKKIRLNYLNRDIGYDYETGELTTIYKQLRKNYSRMKKQDGSKRYTYAEVEAKIRQKAVNYAIDELIAIRKGKVRTQEQADKEEK